MYPEEQKAGKPAAPARRLKRHDALPERRPRVACMKRIHASAYSNVKSVA